MKVLVIDDNKDITDVISIYMESQNISCTICNSGKEGFDTIKKDKFNFIVLDIAMPEFSGLDVIQSLLNENLIGSNNIVVCTASSLSSDIVSELKSVGIKDVLSKPLSKDTLQKVIDKFR